MTEEVAIRIAEALEAINGGIRAGVWLMIGLGIAFWLIAIWIVGMFKN